MLFLQSLAADPNAAMAGGFLAGGLLAMILGMLVFFLIIMAAIYVYMSLAFMGIAKKAKYPSPGLAWIPLVGPSIVASSVAKMHWWPILLLLSYPLVFVFPLFIFIAWIAMLVYAVFFVIWMWKTFEAVGKPGWWAIFQVLPIVNIVWFVFIGIAAWSKD
jgi:hypothetical protein